MIDDTAIIRVDSLFKEYPAGLIRKRPALVGVSFRVSEGEVFGIVGRNGAGKSTLIKILLGLLRPDAGQVWIGGSSPDDPKSRLGIGYLPESPCLYQNLTVMDHFSFIARVRGIDVNLSRRIASRLLEKVRLSEAAGIPIRKFSKGMMQRAALACALFADPDVLILDEPMSGLDPIGRQLVVDLIKDYHGRGKTILFCSHILTDVERICDRIGVMDGGRLIAVVAPDELAETSDRDVRTEGISPLEAYFLKLLERGGRG